MSQKVFLGDTDRDKIVKSIDITRNRTPESLLSYKLDNEKYEIDGRGQTYFVVFYFHSQLKVPLTPKMSHKLCRKQRAPNTN